MRRRWASPELVIEVSDILIHALIVVVLDVLLDRRAVEAPYQVIPETLQRCAIIDEPTLNIPAKIVKMSEK
jgi:hypothetical protein